MSEPRQRRSRLRRWAVSLAVVAVCLYAPFGWILWIDYPWNAHRLTWLAMWPVLPGYYLLVLVQGLAGELLLQSLPGFILVISTLTLGLLAGLTWLGSRRWWALPIVAVLTLAIAIPAAMGMYSVFFV